MKPPCHPAEWYFYARSILLWQDAIFMLNFEMEAKRMACKQKKKPGKKK